MSRLRIQHIRDLHDLDGLQETWRTLERLEGGPSIFQSWSWNRLWCDEVLPHRRHSQLDVRVIEDGAGRTLAIVPLFSEPLAGPIASVTQFLGHRMSFHNDVLLSEPHNGELAGEVARLLFQDLGRQTILHLRDLNEASLFTQYLGTCDATESQSPRVYLRADPSLPDPLMRLGSRSRKSLRNHRNRLQRQYHVEFQRCSGQEILAAFDILIELHHKRFSSQRRSSSLSGPNLAFLRHACMIAEPPVTFEVSLLKANGRAIASELAAHDGRHYFSMVGGFDPDFASFSPSYLLFLEVMRHGFNDLGCEIFDFGPGYEKYKYDWSPTVGTNYMCCQGGPGWYAKAITAVYRAAFRSRLPTVPTLQDKRMSSTEKEAVLRSLLLAA